MGASHIISINTYLLTTMPSVKRRRGRPPTRNQPPVGVSSSNTNRTPQTEPVATKHDESVGAHDEADIFSFRTSAISKFISNNELLDNLITKYIPIDSIIPPASFPGAKIGGKKFELKNLKEDEKVALTSRLATNSIDADDVLLGDINLIRLKSELLQKQLHDEEEELKNAQNIDNLIDDEFIFMEKAYNKLALLHTRLSSNEDFQSQKDSLSLLQSELKDKFNKRIDDDQIVRQLSTSKLNAGRISVTADEAKEALEMLNQKKQEAYRLQMQEQQQKQQQEAQSQTDIQDMFQPPVPSFMPPQSQESAIIPQFNGSSGNTNSQGLMFQMPADPLENGSEFSNPPESELMNQNLFVNDEMIGNDFLGDQMFFDDR